MRKLKDATAPLPENASLRLTRSMTGYYGERSLPKWRAVVRIDGEDRVLRSGTTPAFAILNAVETIRRMEDHRA